ncbi:myo-inositol-1(or 4)-monophosphatase [Malonomonas rubra DSM 5091]|uniref:Inositol-1-monophosphatase n=1 Tax=Malonomonas rubra DSM 5091 TaxID=1122189 RepID=A0A1M6J7S2_MALRU|nr:inositol monophosphatase [Malonomonas rubra]SHJ42715.1 myo-inositol-1(or 4)-monophosphatase [Malonomonas rubra DSM 5091]
MIDTQLLKHVRKLVTEVGAYQLSRFRSLPPGGGEEKSAREFVSEVDRHSEDLLLKGLGNLLPEAGFYGEETGISGSSKLRWVIDPLDGTSNFLSGLDQFCISVALEVEGQTELGVVLRPASKECFTALRGQGLFRNDHRCPQVTDLPLQQALIGTGFPFRSRDLSAEFFACAEEVLYASRGLRRFGAAALDLSYVAAGFLQGFWESDLEPYDVAAALIFLRESGCIVTNRSGKEYSPYRDRLLVCGPPQIHASLVALVKDHYSVD